MLNLFLRTKHVFIYLFSVPRNGRGTINNNDEIHEITGPHGTYNNSQNAFQLAFFDFHQVCVRKALGVPLKNE